MISIFGGNYNELGDTNSNLLLKTQGSVKIQVGDRFIDLLDEIQKLKDELNKLKS